MRPSMAGTSCAKAVAAGRLGGPARRRQRVVEAAHRGVGHRERIEDLRVVAADQRDRLLGQREGLGRRAERRVWRRRPQPGQTDQRRGNPRVQVEGAPVVGDPVGEIVGGDEGACEIGVHVRVVGREG